jgi:large subunit ribosomal protein L35
MPKAKTVKAATKRFRKTKTGKLKHSRPGKAHLLSNKSSRRKQKLRQDSYVQGNYRKKLKKMI